MNRRFALRWINALIIGAAGCLFATGALAQAKGGPAKAASAPPATAQTIRIAYIDPLSGPFAGVGSNLLKHFQFTVDAIPLGATGKMLKAKLREQFKDYRLPTA